MNKILVFIFLLVTLGLAVYLVGQQTHLFSKADVSITPQNIKITNISDNSFTISWTTQKSTTGFIKFGENQSLGNSLLDERDQDIPKPHFTHYVILENLQPDKTYFYNIDSGGETYDQKGVPFQQKTAPTTENPPNLPEPIFGTIDPGNNQDFAEALIYCQLKNGSLLSTFTRENKWLITVNNARSEDLASYIIPQDSDEVKITVALDNDNIKTIKSTFGNPEAWTQIALAGYLKPQSSSSSQVVQTVSQNNNILDWLRGLLSGLGLVWGKD
ncbi:MAG: fibronectin type III domain-containing protein [Candidatus Daviesbacteria bacterium]